MSQQPNGGAPHGGHGRGGGRQQIPMRGVASMRAAFSETETTRLITTLDNFHKRTYELNAQLINLNGQIVSQLSDGPSDTLRAAYLSLYSLNLQLAILYESQNQLAMTTLRDYMGGGGGATGRTQRQVAPMQQATSNVSRTLYNGSLTAILGGLLNGMSANAPNNASSGGGLPTAEQIAAATEVTRFAEIENPISTVCPISQNEFTPNSPVTCIRQCRHIFDSAELAEWFRRNSHCPVCRYDIRNGINGGGGAESTPTVPDNTPAAGTPAVVPSPSPSPSLSSNDDDDDGEPIEEVTTYFMSVSDSSGNANIIPLSQHIDTNPQSNRLSSNEMDRMLENVLGTALGQLSAEGSFRGLQNTPVRIRTTFRDQSGNVVRENVTNSNSNIINNLFG